MNDVELYEAGYNRVYDTLEPETNLNFVEGIVAQILDKWDAKEMMCSYKLNREIGRYLHEHVEGRGILKSAFEKNVPVFVPAFTDSELGLDVALHNRKRKKEGRQPIDFNPFLDLEYFAENLLKQVRLGIFTIGGGVPRNWSQQFGPFIELRHRRGGEDIPLKRYHYGLRICPEPVHWGGLSGSPYSEAISWGKFVPPAEGGKFGEVFVDATVGLPHDCGRGAGEAEEEETRNYEFSAEEKARSLAPLSFDPAIIRKSGSLPRWSSSRGPSCRQPPIA